MWASEPNWTYDGSGIGNNVNGSPYYGRRNGNLGQSYIRFYNGDVYIATGSGDATNRVFIQNNGNVGIGTTSPTEKLDVVGNIKASGVAYWGNSGTRTETRYDAGAMGVRSGFYETSAPAPAANWPAGASGWWHLLDIRHSNTGNNYAMQFAGSFFDQDLYFRKTNNNAAQPWVKILTTANGVDGSGTLNYVPKWTPDGTTLGNSQIFDNGTNVGIGTTSPGQKLTVNDGNIDVIGSAGGLRLGASNWSDGGTTYGHIISDNGSYKALMIVGNDISGNSGRGREVKIWDYLNVQGGLNITGQFYSVGNTNVVTNLNADMLDGHHWSEVPTIPANNVTGSGTTNYVTKWTGTYTQGNSIIYDNGTNVGIGTTSPNGLLDVRGRINVTEIAFRNADGGDDSDPYRLRKYQSSSNSNWLELQLNDDGDEGFRIYGYSCSGYGCGEYSGNLYHFFRADGNAYHSGSLGIGTTTPTAQLHTTGSVRFEGVGSTSTNTQILTRDGSGNLAYRDAGAWAGGSDNVNGSGVATRVAFWSGANTLSYNDYLSWDNNNSRLGVGISVPGAKLDIKDHTDAGIMLYLTDDNNTSGELDHKAIQVQTQGVVQAWLSTNGNAYLSNNLGIGTTSPTKKLQVNGTFGVDIDNNNTSPPHTGYVASTDIAYSRDDISGWTTLHGSGQDDYVSSAQSIDFTFNLFGTDYTTFYVSTNGWISFGSAPGSSELFNNALPTSSFSMPVICPYWDDMKTTGNGIRTTLLGTSPNRVRIIDFELITYNGSYAVTFQVILHEKSNLISIRYYLVAPDACGQSATIGIQGPGGSVATAVPISYNAKVLDDNAEPLSISFCPVIY